MLSVIQAKPIYNPIDAVESMFQNKSVEFERRSSTEVVAEVEGKWDNMLLFFAWEEHLHCLHISCLMNIDSSASDTGKIFELLALINEDLWLGHFSYWNERKMPMFKHSLIVNPEEGDFFSRLEQVVSIAVSECEHMYPVFKAVLTQNMSPRQVLFPAKMFMQ